MNDNHQRMLRSQATELSGTIDAWAVAVFAYLVLMGTIATFGLYMSSDQDFFVL